MFFASYAKGMAQVWTLIVLRIFNEGIARRVTSLGWYVLNKYIKFICITFIWVLLNNLIVEFYRPIRRNPI